MKKKVLLYTALLAFSSTMYSSCDKVKDLVKAINIEWTGIDVTFKVPPITDITNNTSVGSGTFVYNLDSLIKDKSSGQFGVSNVDNFTLSSCTFTITDPGTTNNNFSNLESASCTVFTSVNTTPVTIGEVTNNPDTYAATLNVPVNTTTNLKPYISSTGTIVFNYDVTGKLRRATTDSLTLTMHVEYNIHATP